MSRLSQRIPLTQEKPLRPFSLDFLPIKVARIASEMSVVTLGRSTGMSRWTIYRIEANQYVPGLEQLVALSRALGRPVQTLFTVTDEPPKLKVIADEVKPATSTATIATIKTTRDTTKCRTSRSAQASRRAPTKSPSAKSATSRRSSSRAKKSTSTSGHS